MDLRELKEKTKEWIRYYNSERLHQALGYKTPDEIFYGHKERIVHELKKRFLWFKNWGALHFKVKTKMRFHGYWYLKKRKKFLG